MIPTLSKPKLLELALCEWIDRKFNRCLIGATGTGEARLATALVLAACRQGLRVRSFTAAASVSKLEQEQKQYTLDRFLGQLDRAEPLICDELGYVSFSRNGVEQLFRLLRIVTSARACRSRATRRSRIGRRCSRGSG